jgi:enoyl-CoA hydratase/carnithine racemase
MTASARFADPRLAAPDGFRVEIDHARERADVILDRPPFNIISMPQRDQLRLVFEALDEDAVVRVIVLRAVGEHFSSGGNIKGFMEASPEHVSKLAWNIAAPARCSKPVIAANRGYCFGVGFEMSLACDFRLVSETCHYALPEQKLGQIPGSGGSARLQKIIGITRTKDIVMRSRRIPARQAYDWGLRLSAFLTPSWKKRPMRWSMSYAHSRRSRSAPPRNCSTTPRTRPCRLRSSSKATATAGCGNQMISAKAWRHFMPSARRCSGAADHGRTENKRKRGDLEDAIKHWLVSGTTPVFRRLLSVSRYLLRPVLSHASDPGDRAVRRR